MEVKKEYIYLFSVVIVISGIFIYNNNKMETYDKSKNICVLYVSGDIEPDFDDKYTENMKNLGKIKLVKYDPIDDASKFDNNNFNEIAKSIADKYNMYDSFVIISGDETLCYLASA